MIPTQSTYDASTMLQKFVFSTMQVDLEDEPSIYLRKRVPPTTIDTMKLQRFSGETSTIRRIMNDIYLLEKNFIFNNAKEVKAFLWNNSFLINYLFEAHSYSVKYFGKDVELQLELNRDFEEHYEVLFVVIKSSSSIDPVIVLDLLNRMDDEWFLNIIGLLQGKLNITAEAI